MIATSRRLALLALAVSLALGCTAEYYRNSADEEVYGIIKEKQAEAGFEETDFDIDPKVDTLRNRLLANLDTLQAEAGIEGVLPIELTSTAASFEDEGAPSGGPTLEVSQDSDLVAPDADLAPDDQDLPDVLVLNLDSCLATAAENSRDFQREKENVYLAALNLTFERFLFQNRYFGGATASAGQDLPEERSGTVSPSGGFTRRLANGASIIFDIGAILFDTFVGKRDESARSFINLAITQPLLRGAGKKIVQEPLTLAERNALYAIRDFERFKKLLAVNVATEMYRVVQQLDRVNNNKANYDRLVRSRERIEALAEAGRTPQFQVDQARQDELSARNSWISTVRNYETSLDRFKLTLGLPTDADIVIDRTVLVDLVEAGIRPVDFDLDGAQSFALENRLDLLNDRDFVADSRRAVMVAENALLTQLDVSFDMNIDNERNKPFRMKFGDGDYIVGLDLDLPLDRKRERNAYRSAIIGLERQIRAYTLAEDNVKLDIRNAIRNLAQAEESYRIQEIALQLAERRVESTELLQQAGRANTRDVLESQEALLATQNGITAALIDHTIARMELVRDMGLLIVDQEGLSYDASTDRYTQAGT